jgi:plastocyanin
MTHSKIVAGIAGLAVAVGGTGVAVAATSAAAPKKVTVKQKAGLKVKPNRYLQDELRFDKDTYTVRTGGVVTLLLTQAGEGPHTLSVVSPKDLPKTGKQIANCKICAKLGKAHGADPNSDAPPKFSYLENGVGQNTPPNLDRPGDSGATAPNKGSKATFKVTAKAGKTLHFMCIIHPWMQAKVKVVK